MSTCSERKQRAVGESRLQAGFTLLELLVGLTVFSLLVVTLYSGFRFGTRSWEAGSDSTEVSNEQRLASAFMRRELGKAYGLAVRDGARWRLRFEGSRERLVFISDGSRYVGQGGLYEMTLAVEGGRERHLSVARRPLDPAVAAASNERNLLPRPLVEEVESAEFAYFGSPAKRMETTWYDSWDGADRLPSLVRVRVSTPTAGDWPDIVIHLKADAIHYDRAVSSDEEGFVESG